MILESKHRRELKTLIKRVVSDDSYMSGKDDHQRKQGTMSV